MTISLPCQRCGAVITADDEDELVARVQTHAARDHDLAHPLSREHILAHLSAEGRFQRGAD